MREAVQTAQFKKDLKRIARSGRYRVEELLDKLVGCHEMSVFPRGIAIMH